MTQTQPSLLTRVQRRSSRLYNRIRGKQFIHILHIGKTGGSAVKYALKKHRETANFVIKLHSHNFRLHDVPDADLAVFFVRDPIDRFVSGFYSRQRKGRPRNLVQWSEAEACAFAEFSSPNVLAQALSSKDPNELSRARAAMEGIQHVRDHYTFWLGNPEYLFSRSTNVLYIGYQKYLSEDFERLKAIIGLPEIQLPSSDIASHRSPDGSDRTLSSNAIENLRRWYANDYQLLDACSELRSHRNRTHRH